MVANPKFEKLIFSTFCEKWIPFSRKSPIFHPILSIFTLEILFFVLKNDCYLNNSRFCALRCALSKEFIFRKKRSEPLKGSLPD